MDSPANPPGLSQPPASTGSVAPPLVVVPSPQRPAPRRRSLWGILAILAMILVLGGSLLLNLGLLAGRLGTDSEGGVQEKYVSHARSASRKVVVIPISGVILADQARSLDWKSRRAVFIGRLGEEVLAETLGKLAALMADDKVGADPP